MHNEDMPTGLDKPSTKGDLKEYTSHLRSEFKQELSTVKTELKDEISAVRTELKDEISAVNSENALTRKHLAVEIIKTRAEVESLGDKLTAVITRTRSDLMQAVEKAIFTAEKVDRDQLYTHDRLDRLEGRVSSLETRLGRKS